MFLKPRYLAIEKAEHATEPPTSIASLFFPSEFRLSYIYLELLYNISFALLFSNTSCVEHSL